MRLSALASIFIIYSSARASSCELSTRTPLQGMESSGHFYIAERLIGYSGDDYIPIREAISQVEARFCGGDKIKIYHVSCRRVSPRSVFSKSCYAESSAGFFFATRDLLGNVTLIYNRWD